MTDSSSSRPQPWEEPTAPVPFVPPHHDYVDAYVRHLQPYPTPFPSPAAPVRRTNVLVVVATAIAVLVVALIVFQLMG